MPSPRTVPFVAALVCLSVMATLPGVAEPPQGETRVVSSDSAGWASNGASWSGTPSATGDLVAFVSASTSLSPGDHNFFPDVFVKDMRSGAVTRVLPAPGVEPNGFAVAPVSISGEGRFVAFATTADNFVKGDSNGVLDVFLLDRHTTEVKLVSADVDRTPGRRRPGAHPIGSFHPAVSDDGRYVAFLSDSPGLVAGDDNGVQDVFIRDTTLEITRRIDSGKGEPDGPSYSPDISADGSLIVFSSSAKNLTQDAATGHLNVFVFDRVGDDLSAVTTDREAEPGHSGFPSLASDAKVVSFQTERSLVPADTNGRTDIYVRDLLGGGLALVSVSDSGEASNGHSWWSSISADGRYVAFDSEANNLVDDAPVQVTHEIFVRDTLLQRTCWASRNVIGTPGEHGAGTPRLSDDGTYVLFDSSSSTITLGDLNLAEDVFRAPICG